MKLATSSDNLDRILSSEEELAPSTGFAASVMDRVREEAAAPEPIAFPWKRVLPGAIVAAAGLVWCVVQMVVMRIGEANTTILSSVHPAALLTRSMAGAAWALAAIGASLLSWLLARRLAGTRGLI